MLTLRRNSETQVSGAQGSETRSSCSVEQTRLSRFRFETRVCASVEKRRRPLVADCRVCLATLEKRELYESRVLFAGLVSIRRDANLALLNIVSGR